MDGRPSNLPQLPGLSFDRPIGKDRHHRSQQFSFANGVASEKEVKASAGKTSTSSQSLSGNPATQPSWLVFDRTTLCFHAYFKQAVHERADEHFRVRMCKIYFFPVDDTIEVIEPKTPNSGLPQGKILRRQRVHKPDGESTFDVRDLALGNIVEFYGRAYKIYNCDEFTSRFLTKLGLPIGEAEEPPMDPHSQKQAKDAAAKQALRPYDKQDKLKQFLDRDRQVLRFYGVWDDTASEYGERRYLVVTYYLADDSVEITEVVQPNSGRDGSATFLKRCQLPKDSSSHVKQPGAVTARTLLNVTGRDGTHILDNLHQGSGASDHYTDRDLEIGTELLVFNRPVLLCDCDDFTKQYYREHYGVEDFTAIHMDPDDGVPNETYEPTAKTIDPADSMSKLTFNQPKPDMKKWLKSGASAMQFKARLDTTDRIDMGREFVVSYYLADDTISVFENEVRNSGIAGGKFIERSKRYTSDHSRLLTPEDFSIDETVILNRFRFVLTDASEFTYRFMEEHGFPGCNIDAALDKVFANIGVDAAGALAAELDTAAGRFDSLSYAKFAAVVQDAAMLTGQETRTVGRNFRAGGDGFAVDYKAFIQAISPEPAAVAQ